MDKREFCDGVLRQVRFATPGERSAIRAELEAHLADHAQVLEELGYDAGTAERDAVEAMGDPAEIGRELDRQYTRFWGWMLRLTGMALALMALAAPMLLILSAIRCGEVRENLRARFRPENLSYRQNVTGVERALDIRVPIGSDIFYIYEVALNAQEGVAAVSYCNYDKNPFGQAARTLNWYVSFVDDAGERLHCNGGGGGGTGAWFYTQKVPVREGQEAVHLRYEAFGERVSVDIPLDWEVGA